MEIGSFIFWTLFVQGAAILRILFYYSHHNIKDRYYIKKWLIIDIILSEIAVLGAAILFAREYLLPFTYP